MNVPLLLAFRGHAFLPCIPEPRFNVFFVQMEASRICSGEALSQENLAKFGLFYFSLELTYSTTESWQCVARTCMFETSPWRDAQTNLALSRPHKMKDSRKTLSVLVSEAAAVLICECHKAGKAYVTADDLDCQTPFPQENWEVMWWWNNLWSESSSTRKEDWHMVTSVYIKHSQVYTLLTLPLFVCYFSLPLLLQKSVKLLLNCFFSSICSVITSQSAFLLL